MEWKDKYSTHAGSINKWTRNQMRITQAGLCPSSYCLVVDFRRMSGRWPRTNVVQSFWADYTSWAEKKRSNVSPSAHDVIYDTVHVNHTLACMMEPPGFHLSCHALTDAYQDESDISCCPRETPHCTSHGICGPQTRCSRCLRFALSL